MGWDPQTPLRGRKGGFTPPYSYKYLFTGIRYNLRNAIKNGDVVKKFWNLLFLIPKTYKKHGKVVSCLENFFNPRDSSGQLCVDVRNNSHQDTRPQVVSSSNFLMWVWGVISFHSLKKSPVLHNLIHFLDIDMTALC